MLYGLTSLAVHGRIPKWIANFLHDRQIYISTNDGESDLFNVNRGVPQGSVLSPLLFNAAMAGLPRVLPEALNISMYADDICIWTSHKSLEIIKHRLQQGLHVISDYLKERGMQISHAKSVVLPFTRKKVKNLKLFVDGQRIEIARKHRFLGVTLDSQLRWSQHIADLENQANSTINVLRRIAGTKWGGTSASLLHVHCALIRQKIAYSAPVLHNISQTSLQRLQLLQARSLRVCLGVPQATSSSLTLAEAREPNFNVIRNVETCRHLFRLVTQHPSHPLISQIENRPGTQIHRVYQQYISRLPASTHWPPDLTYPPWLLELPTIETSIEGLRSKHDVPAVAALQLASHHLFDRYQGYTHVYTDGSVNKETATSAFIIPELYEEYACRLGHLSSSTTSELVAILLAIGFIKLSTTPRRWVVITDSLAALACVENATSGKIDIRIVYAILKELSEATKSGHHVAFQWVPSHCGIKGNEMADELAKSAHHYTQSRLIPVSQCEINRILRRTKRELCLSTWFPDSTKESILYAVDPNLECQLDPQLPRRIDTLIHRLRLGTAYTKHFLFRIHRASSSTCSCGHDDEDVHHLLLDCPKHDTHRQ